MAQLVTFRLNQLRCIVESDGKGGSEPYLWVTYFVVDGRNITRPDPVTTHTPIYDAFRTEFPNDVRDGQVINVPSFIGNFSFEIDPGPLGFMMAGCVVVLMEEDDTPDSAIRAGRNAFASAIHQELNDLIRSRIRSLDRQPVTEEEVKAIRSGVESSVKSAIKSKLSFWQKLFGDQDDALGFGHVAFADDEITTRHLVFPELANKDLSNRFELTGTMTVGPIPPEPVDTCATLRAAVKAKSDEVKGLHSMKSALQQQLQTAGPQAKADIIKRITQVSAEITQAEEELRQRESALKQCEEGVLDPTPGGIRGTGVAVEPVGGIART